MSEIIEYKIPIKKYGQLIFVFGTATIVLGLLILSIPFLAIIKPDFHFQKEFIGFLIFFPLLLMYSMWLILGYEKLIIKDQTIELLKSNRIFTKRNSISISAIRTIEVVEKRFNSDKWIDVQRERIREKQRAFPIWIKMGQLILITENGDKTFFNGLSKEEAPIIKDKILKEIEKRKHNKTYKGAVVPKPRKPTNR